MGNILTNPLLMAPVITLLAQGLKALPIPFAGKTLAGILAALTLLTVIAKVAIALLTGSVDNLDLATLLPQAYEAIVTILASAGIFSLAKKGLDR